MGDFGFFVVVRPESLLHITEAVFGISWDNRRKRERRNTAMEELEEILDDLDEMIADLNYLRNRLRDYIGEVEDDWK